MSGYSSSSRRSTSRFSLRKMLTFVFTRAFAFSLLLILELVLIFIIVWKFFDYSLSLYLFGFALSFLVAVNLISSQHNPAYKLSWIFVVFAFPPMGALTYLLFGLNRTSRARNLIIKKLYLQTIGLLHQDKAVFSDFLRAFPCSLSQFRYLYQHTGESLYRHTSTRYLPSGESFFRQLLQELKKAEQFIFLEYFIVEEGVMWDAILSILVEKVSQGVEVRLLYDDVGCLLTLPTNYAQKMNQLGIKTVVFNRFRPFLATSMNYRDHRKIVVIDGKVGFTGGINLADEYINAVVKHGHWKDTAIMIKGEAVWSLTVKFLQFWNLSQSSDHNYKKYFVDNSDQPSDGFVQPFADSPRDQELVSKNVYLGLINQAKKYLYITTPYLIIDNEMVTALTLAAKSGIDVRIIVPGVPDKWYIYYLSQAFYIDLIEAGVKIYEYLPGFIHAKTFLVDDTSGVVGTINLDYRSLYLNFECGILLYGSSALRQMKADWHKTLDQCHLVDLSTVKQAPLLKRITRGFLKVLAPLM